MKVANAGPIFEVPEVGGVLIGGASLKATDFDAVLGMVREQARHHEFGDSGRRMVGYCRRMYKTVV